MDVEPALLDAVSTLGSGTRVIGVYPMGGAGTVDGFNVYLHAVGDPGNVGAIIRTAHGLLGARVVLGPGCADPFGPKAVRASMGSIFGKPPIPGRWRLRVSSRRWSGSSPTAVDPPTASPSAR